MATKKTTIYEDVTGDVIYPETSADQVKYTGTFADVKAALDYIFSVIGTPTPEPTIPTPEPGTTPEIRMLNNITPGDTNSLSQILDENEAQ